MSVCRLRFTGEHFLSEDHSTADPGAEEALSPEAYRFNRHVGMAPLSPRPVRHNEGLIRILARTLSSAVRQELLAREEP